MDLIALAALLYEQLPGEIAEPVGDQIEGWQPQPNHCHDNATAWVALHPLHRRVPGWVPVPYMTPPNRMRFLSHSVIATETGDLLDVTLGATEAPHRFIRHPGTPEEFYAVVPNNGVPSIDHVLGPDPEIEHGPPVEDFSFGSFRQF